MTYGLPNRHGRVGDARWGAQREARAGFLPGAEQKASGGRVGRSGATSHRPKVLKPAYAPPLLFTGATASP